MSITKQRSLDYIQSEWGTYVERFKRLPQAEGEKRVRQMGYERFRDMLAHIAEWWDEGMEIILAVAENRELTALYARLRAVREGTLHERDRAAFEAALHEIHARLSIAYPDDWLLRLELLELAQDARFAPDWTAQIRKDLQRISHTRRDRGEMICRGLELLEA